jgi:hypothetical protein
MISDSIDLSGSKASVLATADAQQELSVSDLALATKLAPSEVKRIVTDLVNAKLLKSGSRGVILTREGVSARKGLSPTSFRTFSVEPESSLEDVSAALDAELSKLRE